MFRATLATNADVLVDRSIVGAMRLNSAYFALERLATMIRSGRAARNASWSGSKSEPTLAYRSAS